MALPARREGEMTRRNSDRLASASILKFPQNREFNREFLRIRGFCGLTASISPVISKPLRQIPSARANTGIFFRDFNMLEANSLRWVEQGIFCMEQGNFPQEQGIFFASSESKLGGFIHGNDRPASAMVGPIRGERLREHTSRSFEPARACRRHDGGARACGLRAPRGRRAP